MKSASGKDNIWQHRCSIVMQVRKTYSNAFISGNAENTVVFIGNHQIYNGSSVPMKQRDWFPIILEF